MHVRSYWKIFVCHFQAVRSALSHSKPFSFAFLVVCTLVILAFAKTRLFPILYHNPLATSGQGWGGVLEAVLSWSQQQAKKPKTEFEVKAPKN